MAQFIGLNTTEGGKLQGSFVSIEVFQELAEATPGAVDPGLHRRDRHAHDLRNLLIR
jgi:hypothetical protein